ncbi:MAG: hypothetical protein WD737_09100 [Gemmatimonadota bacterium]
MVKTSTREMDIIGKRLIPLDGGERDHDALIEQVGGVRVVLLGEALDPVERTAAWEKG